MSGAVLRCARCAAALCGAWLLLWCAVSTAQDVGERRQRVWSGPEVPLRSVDRLASWGGYLWIGSYSGLARFDGSSFEVLPSQQVGLPSDRIINLGVSPGGTLWVHTDGNRLMELRGDRFAPLRAPGQEDSPVVRTMRCGDRLMGWNNTHLYAWSPEHELRILHSFPATNWLGGGCFSQGDAVLLSASQALWLPGRGEQRTFSVPGSPNNAFIRSHEGPGGRRWLSTLEGLYEVGPQGLEEVLFEGERLPGLCEGHTSPGGTFYGRTEGAWWKINGRLEKLRDADSTEWCTAVLLFQGQEVYYATGSQVWRDGGGLVAELPGPVAHLEQSPQGDIWAAMSRQGLARLRAPEVEVLEPGYRLVFPLLYTRAGELLAGVWHQGVARWSPQALQERAAPDIIKTRRTRTSSGFLVSSLYEDRRGRIWAGSWDGLRPLEEAEEPSSPMAEISSSSVRAFLEDRQGRSWLARDTGLYQGDLAHPEAPWRPLGEAQGLPGGARIYALLEPAPGGLLVGTGGHGVYYRAPGQERFSPVEGPPSLSQSHARYLYEDPEQGDIWLGTESSGLCLIQWEQGAPVARCVSPGQRLPSPGVHCALPDGQGRLWFSSNEGISWVSRAHLLGVLSGQERHLLPVTLGVHDGMDDAECNGGFQNPCVRDGQGRLYFPTQRGIAQVDPASVRSPEPGAPRLVSVQIEGEPPRWSLDGEAVAVQMGPQQRRLRVRWSSPQLYHGEQSSFEVRLRGMEQSWLDTRGESVATWTNLPPGDYTLEVRAGLGSVWSQPTTLATVQRQAALEEMAWFRALVALALLLGVGIITWRYILGLRRRRDALERTVLERTATIAERNQELEDRAQLLSGANEALAQQQSLLEERSLRLGQANAALLSQKAMLAERTRQLAEQAERLTELSEVKNRFVANVSHELRTPLTLVQGAVRDLLGREELSPTAQRRLQVALRNAERLGELVEQLLEVARLEAGAVSLKVRRLDLASFLRRVAGRFAHHSEQQGIVLQLELEPEALPVYFAEDMVDKVLTNLLGNAFKFTPAQGHITLRLRTLQEGEQRLVRVEVIDSGPGIPAPKRRRLFERFYQVDQQDPRAPEGSGLGLAIARELVELHGGQIGAEAAPEGGSLFWFTLPLGVAHLSPEEIDTQRLTPMAQPALSPLASRGGDSLRVLVVEDHPDMRAYLVEHLQEQFQVQEAQDGAQALELALQSPPDVIVSDIMMPVMDGLEMARALRAAPRTASTPVLLVSAKGGQETRLESLELADDFLGKPFLMPELISRVRHLAARHTALQRQPEPLEAEDPAPSLPSALPLVDQQWLERLQALLEEQLHDAALCVDDLADAMNMSRRAFYRNTKRLVGSPPASYLRELRLQRAEILLKEGAYSTVAEVAAQVGMTATYFARAYKSRFGVSPGQHLRS